MKALVKETAGVGMTLKDVPTPKIGANDVLIRVRHAGVCGTDLHIWEWDAWASGRLKPPVVIGHEFAGEIAEMGVEAKASGLVQVGDKVVMAADGNGEWTRALGLELDAARFGMGTRSQRFAMVLDDGVVKKLAIEAPGKFEVSSAEAILQGL